MIPFHLLYAVHPRTLTRALAYLQHRSKRVVQALFRRHPGLRRAATDTSTARLQGRLHPTTPHPTTSPDHSRGDGRRRGRLRSGGGSGGGGGGGGGGGRRGGGGGRNPHTCEGASTALSLRRGWQRRRQRLLLLLPLRLRAWGSDGGEGG